MEELNDDELQDLLANGSISGNKKFSEQGAEDLLLYKDLFKALETEPLHGLPFNFASNIRRKLQARQNKRSDFRFNVVAVTTFGVSLALGYGLLQLTDQSAAELVLNTVLKFKWILFSAICFFLFLLTIDQYLVKREY
jgi:hypothetical protein